MKTHSCSSPSCWLHLSDQSLSSPSPPLRSCLFLFYLYFTQWRAVKTLNVKKKKKNRAFLLSGSVCMYITPPRWAERAVRGVLCCWSPPLPFACLSDVLLGWAPHSDGVDKMTGGGHTPVNVNLAAKHRSADAPTHQNRLKKKIGEERGVVYKRKSPKEFHIYIIYTRSRTCIQRRTPYSHCSSPRVMRTHAAAKITSQQLQLSDTYQKSLSKCFLTFTIMMRWWWLGCERRFPVVRSRGAPRSPSFSCLSPLSWRDG